MLIRGDARYLPLVDGCVDCVVTSPPYWGLRRYPDPRQIGLEPTPEAYVDGMRRVFDSLHRVLKDTGTVWLNLGDSYCTTAPGTGMAGPSATSTLDRNARLDAQDAERGKNVRPMTPAGLKPKDMVGVPWRVAFALQADGWFLRSDIVWAKPNCMPESVTDRPTRAHEYVFLLAKSHHYFYDAEAIREPYSDSTLREFEQPYDGVPLKDYAIVGVQNPSALKKRMVDKQRGHSRRHAGFNDRWDAMPKKEQQERGANRRSCWFISPQPYGGAHFATMPEKLVEPCILAGCPLGGLVLDPFVGSGTVVAVAERLGRRGVGLDLSYQDLSKERTAQRGLRFA
jgi:DNA modification methylase